MKKICKTLFCILFSSLILTSCGAKDIPINNDEPIEGKSYIVENGFANYYIVNSTKPLENETYAANELSYFLGLSTNSAFSIINDTKVRDNYKYISIGDTSMFQEKFSSLDKSRVDASVSGYFISTVDDNIYIYSSPNGFGYGCLYGVYDLLEKLIGYKYYSDDEIFYEQKANIKVLEYKNKFVFPSFDVRTLSNSYFHSHLSYSKRLRQNPHTVNELWCKQLMGHNLVKYYLSPIEVNPETGNKFVDDCPNWFGGRTNYNGDTGYLDNRLCYCSDEEGSPHKGLLDHCANKLFRYVKENPGCKYFMFGQEDNDDTGCECDLCEEARKTWAGNTAGLEIHWMNQLIEKVESMINADPNEKGREITYVMYAYRATKKAPIIRDGNNVVPFSEKVIPNKKLMLMLGDTETNYTQPLTAPCNAGVYQNILEWKSLAPNQIILYNYDVDFYEYFMNFPNFSAVTSFYRTCRDLGIAYMFFNGADAYTPCFYKMRMYCEASLLWNADLVYDDLAYDFCKHFYKDAWEDMYELYSSIRDYYAYLMTNTTSFGVYTDINKTDKWFFPKEYLDSLTAIIYKALDKISYIESINPEAFTNIRDRIYDEYLTVIYMKIKLYKSYYTNNEIKEMKSIWDYCINKFGYTKNAENGVAGSLDIFN